MEDKKSIYLACSRLFKDLYKSKPLFKKLINSEDYVSVYRKEDSYYVDSEKLDLDVQSYFKGISGIGIVYNVVLSSVYKYSNREGFLYSGLEVYKNGYETEIVTLDALSKVYEYPDKSVMLGKTFKIDLKDDVLSEILKSFNKGEGYIVGRLFMDNDDLCLMLYSPLIPCKKYVYGSSGWLDVIFESLITRLGRYSISVNEIYFFLNGSYNVVKAKELVGNEYMLVIS